MHRFDSMVEAVRVGTIISRDRKALNKWQRRSRPNQQRGLTGAELENAVRSLQMSNPEYVVVGNG